MKNIVFMLMILLMVFLCACSERCPLNTYGGFYTEPQGGLADEILKAYKLRLIEKIYHYDNSRADTLPTYALYDFDSDGLPELLIWDIRVSTASFRDIYVYRFNVVTGEADHIGTMIDFAGHSTVGAAQNGWGVVIAIRDSGDQDRVVKYTYSSGRLISRVLLSRTDESSQQWFDISAQYFDAGTIPTANTYNYLEEYFKDEP